MSLGLKIALLFVLLSLLVALLLLRLRASALSLPALIALAGTLSIRQSVLATNLRWIDILFFGLFR